LGLVCACTIGLLLADDSHAAFDIDRDAFSISNEPGYCFAMAAFARWYYLRNSGEPGLRLLLNQRIQTKIARDLQRFYSKHLIGVQADYCNEHHRDQRESYRRFLAGLTIGEPRIVLLMNKGNRGVVLHAVLAYEWLPEKNRLKVYDPNYPNQRRVVDLESKEYTSLDITYSEICFPEVLHHHRGLVKRMERLFRKNVAVRSAALARPASFRPR